MKWSRYGAVSLSVWWTQPPSRESHAVTDPAALRLIGHVAYGTARLREEGKSDVYTR